MRKFMKNFLVLLLLITFNFNFAAGKKYLLEFKFNPGQVFKYYLKIDGTNYMKLIDKKNKKNNKESKTNFEIKMYNKGEVQKVENGVYDILYTIEDATYRIDKNPPQPISASRIKTYVKVTKNGKVLGIQSNMKNQYIDQNTFFTPLPKKPIPIGYSWKVEKKPSLNNPVPMMIKYTLKKVDGNIAVIDVVIASKKAKGVSVKTTAAGKIYFDMKKGMIVKTLLNSKVYTKLNYTKDQIVIQKAKVKLKMVLK